MRANRKVLVLNAGSSSLKFALVDPHSGEHDLSGIGDALGSDQPHVQWRYRGQREERKLPLQADHADVLSVLVGDILAEMPALREQIIAVGHRIVHGGEHFARSVRIDAQVLNAIEDCTALAPLHNPAGLLCIRAAMETFSALPQVAVFDTGFHHDLPERAFLYALPYSLYREHRIRRYGMHGISCRYICERVAQLLERPRDKLNIICAHLGNGASVTAIQGGRSVDTSMGMTPLEGLVMGTRCGDLDAGVQIHLAESLGYSAAEISRLLNRESGLLGISELSNDRRELERAAADGHRGAQLALEIFCYRLAKYIAAYTVSLQRVDALVFTGGIGEHSALVREMVLGWLACLGYAADAQRNRAAGEDSGGAITGPDSKLALVVPTDEESIIARDTAALVGRG